MTISLRLLRRFASRNDVCWLVNGKIEGMNEKKIYKLHKKYSKGVNQEIILDAVWGHSLIVKDIALELVKNLEKRGIKINKKLVEIGCLVHDIGCYECYEFYGRNKGCYIQHGIRGYEILKKEGFGEEIARMATIHLGVGLVEENVVASGLPLEHKDYIPITLEEELVAYADNFHSKSGPKFDKFENSREKLAKLWPESVMIFDRFRKKFGEPELKKLEKKYNKWQKEMEKKIRKFKDKLS